MMVDSTDILFPDLGVAIFVVYFDVRVLTFRLSSTNTTYKKRAMFKTNNGRKMDLPSCWCFRYVWAVKVFG